MWIRNQDKTELIKVKRVQVDGKKIYTTDGFDVEGTVFIPLGIYENKERALKVLDDIQQKLINGTTFDRIDRYGERATRDYVYEMPQS